MYSNIELPQSHHTKDEIDNYAATEELIDGWVSSPWPASYMIPTIHQSLLNGIEEYKTKGMIQREPGRPRKEDIRIASEPENFYVKGTDVEPILRLYYSDLDKTLSNTPKETGGNLEEIIHNAAWAYYAFERIHPFLDGNGRTGRIILNRVLGGAGIEKIIFLDSWINQERETHLDTMNLADRLGTLDPLELYIANVLSTKKTLKPFSAELEAIIEKKEKSILAPMPPQPINRIWDKFGSIDIAGSESFIPQLPSPVAA